MPVYSFKCKSCGEKFDFLKLPGREEKITCPKCGSLENEKLITGFNAGKSEKGDSIPSGSCCGNPNSCGTPGQCCGM